ncbi:MAG: beta strand repeat-containing protein, partial [Planctomycetia bacterium]
TQLQAFVRIAGISGTANANGGDAINKLSATAASFGEVRASVLGGRAGSGLVDSQIKAWTNSAGIKPSVQLDGIFADVRSAIGAGILRSTVGVKGDLVAVVSKALGAAAISTSTFETSGGDIGRIAAESINGGTAIDMSSFTAHNGSIGSAQSEGEVATKGVSAKAGSRSPLAHGISGSFFTADGNIGFVVATANGGCGITGSTFLADADAGNSNNGPNLGSPAPSDDVGAIFGIHATTSGQNAAQSVGINASAFTGESIASITVDVTDREEGGAGILASTFTARNAVADGNGNFDNSGSIGAITVTNNSLRGNGIEASRFSAGAAGGIGDITVTTLGGTGIKGSFFQASAFDLDQNRFTSTIGNIRVRAGRTSTAIGGVQPPNDGWTLVAAGIDSSYFAANAGIGNVDVRSVGTSIFFSAFLADFDFLGLGPAFPYSLVGLLGQNTPGSIGNVTVTSTGRFGSGVVFSAFAGVGIGDVRVTVSAPSVTGEFTPARPAAANNPILAAENRLETVVEKAAFRFAQQDKYGLVGVAGSLFLATNAGIGQVSVTNTSATGISSVFSAYVSLGNSGDYGPVRFSPAAPTETVGWWIFSREVPTNLFWGRQRTAGASTPVTPTVSSVGGPAAARYRAGTSLLFTVTFARPVVVVGMPSLPLTLGTAAKTAGYVGGSGTDTLAFRYTVVAGDNAPAGIAVAASLPQSIDNRISDLATSGAAASLDLPAVDSSKVVVDTTAPSAVTVVQPAYGPYVAGRTIEARVRFSEAVTVSGVPSLPVFFGTQARTMRFSRIDGTDVVFSYVVRAADVALRKHARTNGLVGLAGGSTVADLAGNTAAAQTQPLADPQ